MQRVIAHTVAKQEMHARCFDSMPWMAYVIYWRQPNFSEQLPVRLPMDSPMDSMDSIAHGFDDFISIKQSHDDTTFSGN